MKTLEIRDLVSGLLVIILIASSIGKLQKLHDFSQAQAVKTLHGWKPHHFFPEAYRK